MFAATCLLRTGAVVGGLGSKVTVRTLMSQGHGPSTSGSVVGKALGRIQTYKPLETLLPRTQQQVARHYFHSHSYGNAEGAVRALLSQSKGTLAKAKGNVKGKGLHAVLPFAPSSSQQVWKRSLATVKVARKSGWRAAVGGKGAAAGKGFRFYSSVASVARAARGAKGGRVLFGSSPLKGSFVSGMSDASRWRVGLWLGLCSAWVFSMVVVGGITRLTRSGLSMTEWKFTGERPPLTLEDWEMEFDKYKRSPEFKKVNLSMTLDEFKFIYWMEYAHRMWGRVLGLAFGVPFLAFLATKQLSPRLTKRLSMLLCMGGAQGFVGWWMVKSGLEEPENKYDVPRVSPYRLAAHLTSAFVIYATLLWTTLQVALPKTAMQKAQELNLFEVCRSTFKLRRVLIPFGCLVSVTAISGAFVAGLDAGHAFNTFPLMGGQVVPEEYTLLWKETGSMLRNTFENTASVQFHHRLLALTTLTAATSIYLGFRGKRLPQHCNSLLTGMCLMSWCQVALGITTLLYYVPVHLGSAHQAGALTLMSITLATIYCTKPHLATRATKGASLVRRTIHTATATSTSTSSGGAGARSTTSAAAFHAGRAKTKTPTA